MPAYLQNQSAKRQLRLTATPVVGADLEALSSPLPLDDNYEIAHTFAPYANWLIRGRLMLGRYPFVEPSRVLDRQTGERQISEILDAGITTFVCLQAELPPQAKIPVGGYNGFLSYAPVASLMAKAREGPIDVEESMGLRNRYVDKFLPQRRSPTGAEEPPMPSSPVAPELQFVHHPITDLSIPEDSALEALLNDLEARLWEGQNLYLHCWGGRGRAGTVGATLLHRLYGLSASECLERVQRGYDTRKDTERRKSPETDEQIAYVRSFIETRS